LKSAQNKKYYYYYYYYYVECQVYHFQHVAGGRLDISPQCVVLVHNLVLVCRRGTLQTQYREGKEPRQKHGMYNSDMESKKACAVEQNDLNSIGLISDGCITLTCDDAGHLQGQETHSAQEGKDVHRNG